MDTQVNDWYERLSPQERQVLEMYAEKHSYKAVALAMGKSESVVDQQLLSARRKMNVTSTAEAMYLLAQRKASLESPVVLDSSPHVIDAKLPANKRFRTVKTFAAIAAGPAILFAIMSSTTQFGRAKVGYTNLSLQEIESKIVRLHSPDNDQPTFEANRIRAELVGALCDKAWPNLWGPREDNVIGIIGELEDDVRTSFEWALANNPDIAIKIAGNCHRFLAKSSKFPDWKSMITRAVAVSKSTTTFEYGRALCGIAYSNWDDDKDLGFRSAEKALHIFENLPNSNWDQANALRHMGLCSKPRSAAQNQLYLRALELYGDDRGRAHTMLSLGQTGFEGPDNEVSPDAKRCLEWNLRALVTFRKIKNRNGVDDAISELKKIEPAMSDGAEFSELRKQIRDEVKGVADDTKALGDIAKSLQLGHFCLRLDGVLRDWNRVSSDIEFMLSHGDGYLRNREAAAELVGYYSELCKRSGTTPKSRVLDFAKGKAVSMRNGQTMNLKQVLFAASRLPYP